MLEPLYLKIDMDVAEGISRKIEQLHEDGESYAAMWAELSKGAVLPDFDEDTDQDSMFFQRRAATFIVLASMIAEEYMETQGWKYDRTEHRWKDPVPQED